MKNYFHKLLFILLLCINTTYAQQVNNTQFKTKTLQVYQNLDKNKVPHGILLNFGMEFTNIKAFNGTLSDSTFTNSQRLSDIYKTLLMSRVKQVNTGFIQPQEYAARWYTQREKGIITLSGQYFKYSAFKTNAYPTQINYTNNQFSDKYNAGVWQNPYAEQQLFAMAPAITKYKGLNFEVKLPSNLFLSNYPAAVQNIQVDFADGFGYRIINYNQLATVNYTQANIYTWKYKITLTNGQVLYSHSKIEIEEGLHTKPLGSNTTFSVSNLADYTKFNITATEAYLGHHATATVYIRYANGGNSITKPLIVAEGFDSGIILNPEQEAGDNNIEDFLDDIDDSNSLLEGEINTYDIIYVDWNNGVDFIQRNAFVFEEVIKWVNQNKVSTEKNVVLGQSMGGLVARYALRDIEVNQSFNHDTRLYVSHDAPHLGANTPLSVQYSARHLRNQYISTPIPLLAGDVIMPLAFDFASGFSNIINFFGGNTSVSTPITPLQAFSLADVPAARQMQYNWVTNSYQIYNVIHDAWVQEYTQLGYPQGDAGQPIRNVAIANGSECGLTQIDNGNIMSYIKDAGKDTFLSNYIGILDAVYGTLLTNPAVVFTALFPGKSYWEIDFQSKYMTTLNQNKNIYHGSIKYKKKVFWFIPVSITITDMNINQPTSRLPYDIYGGGIQQTNPNQLPLSGITSNPFGFIPTASAIDVGSNVTLLNDNDYREQYVGALPPIAPKNTEFDNFVTHFNKYNPNSNNTPHISFNRRNGDWLRTELNVNIPNTVTDCSAFCSNAKITGDDYLCGTGIYTVTNDITTINWSITDPNNLVSFTTNFNEITINQTNTNQNGTITLNVTYGNNRCGFVTISKDIWVGKPNVTSHAILGGYDNQGINSSSQLHVDWAEEATEYYWFFGNVGAYTNCAPNDRPKFLTSNGYAATMTSPSRYVSINWGKCTGDFVVNCKAVNDCGMTGISHKIVQVYDPNDNNTDPCDQDPWSLKTYPNPIKKGSLTVSKVAPGLPCNERVSKKRTLNNVKIYDFYGILVYKDTFKANDFTIEDLNLKEGHYVLHVTDTNGETLRKLIIVE